MSPHRPIAVLYEHPDWFAPLFDALERRGTPYRRLDARRLAFDPAAEGVPGWDREDVPPALLLNRMSPSAHLRGLPGGVAWTRALLAAWELRGVRVVNGSQAFALETSKARQIAHFDRLGLPHPETRVVHGTAAIPGAAEMVGYPLVVKPNLGGSGAGIRRFGDAGALRAALEVGEVELGPDGTALVQEWVPARDGRITRFEVLDGRLLYAIHVTAPPDCYDLCPADLVEGDEAGRVVEAADPHEEVVRRAERAVAAAEIAVGGIEAVVDDRDGTFRFYDLNALSNFVADAERVVGIDPFDRLAAWLGEEARRVEQRAAAGAGTAARRPGAGVRRGV